MNNILKGDIYFCNLSKTQGSVQSGGRFCIVVSNNTGNIYSPTVMVVPCTTKKKHNLPTHFDIMLDKNSTVLCESILTIDKTQMERYYGRLSAEELTELNRRLIIALGL